MSSYLADGLDAAALARRSAQILGCCLRIPVAGPLPCANPVFEMTTSSGRLLITAVDYLPPADLRAAARRQIAQSERPTAVVVFHPHWATPWQWDTNAFVTWAEEGAVVAADMQEASMGLDVGRLEFLSDDGRRHLLITPQGWSVPTRLDANHWRKVRSEATSMWADVIVPAARAA